MLEFDDIGWGISYNGSEITITINCFKCKDILLKETYICRDKNEFYSMYDISQVLNIRDILMKKAYDLNKLNKTDAEVDLENFIKEHSGIWDLNDTKDFILDYKDELIKIIERL